MPELPMTEHHSISPELIQRLCVTPATRVDNSLSLGTIRLQRHSFHSWALMALQPALPMPEEDPGKVGAWLHA